MSSDECSCTIPATFGEICCHFRNEHPHSLAPLTEGRVEGALEWGLPHESIDVISIVGHFSGASNEHVEGLDRTITLI